MVSLYLDAFKLHLKSQMQYRVSFFVSILGQFLVSFTTFLGLIFLFTRFHAIGDFSYEEVLLCYAIMLMSFALGECFGRGFDRFSTMIGNGEFDRMLVRPRYPIYQILLSNMDFSRMGRLLQALVVLIYTVMKINIVWTWDRGLTLIIMIVSGGILFGILFFLGAAISFFTIESLEVLNIFTDGGYEFGRYPFSIYGKSILKLLTFCVPLALVQYYPLLYITGRETNSFFMFLPVFSMLFVVPCYLLWRLGLHKYRSTGS